MFDTPEDTRKVLAETDLGTAYSSVPAGYAGPCKMTANGRTESVAVFPSVVDAEHAARFAVGTLGGFLTSHVVTAEAQTPTYASWDLWAFEF